MLSNFPRGGQPVPNVGVAVENAAFIASFPLVVLLRREFGERFVTPSRFGFCLLVLGLFAWLVGRPVVFGPLAQVREAVAEAAESVSSAAKSTAAKAKKAVTGKDAESESGRYSVTFRGVPVLFVAFVAASVYHMVATYRRVRRPDATPTLTTYSGRPWLAAVLGDEWEGWVKRFVEPGGCFALGYFVVSAFDPFLGVYVAFAAFALFLAENAAYQRYRNALLDLYDSHLIARYMKEDADVRLKTGTRGLDFAESLSREVESVVVKEYTGQPPRESSAVGGGLASLAGELRAGHDKPPAAADGGVKDVRVTRKSGSLPVARCPACGAQWAVQTKWIGKVVACKGEGCACRVRLRAAAGAPPSFTPPPPAKPERPEPEVVRFACPECGSSNRGTSDQLGTVVMCGHCDRQYVLIERYLTGD